MNALEVFEFNGAEVRTLTRDGEPWFVASDVARVLGYRDAEKMIRNLDADEMGTHIVGTHGGDQRVSVIGESGLYAAVLRSRRPEAREFRRWVTGEVLPTIRKTGGYVREDATAQQIAELKDMLTTQLELMRPGYEHASRQELNRGGVTLRALADEWGVTYPIAFDVAMSFGDIERVAFPKGVTYYEVTPMGRQSARVLPGDARGRSPRVTPKGRAAYLKRLEAWSA
ncbi:Bro-N domain-containing protein [Streptomyces sp. H27-C3]|uniref:BRO-N domain-containing protein n=1 Tax=Streptomyces sp. H27-C3 TaxID=3046305 RepID=UPI0024B96A9F|nr:Bro-N domain-containing protein [Streptomyces sp. H27-C3]MDJ0461997.1 Bro-N domain-containing protein [Streptomyces sp. H27-C3]